MAVKKGYKQTEVGVIPEEWDEVRFSALEPFITSGSRGWARYYSDRGELFIRITNMSRATIYLDLDDPRFVKLPTTSHEGARTCVQEGDILISVTADIGIISLVSSIVPKPAYINQHIALIRFPLRRVDSKFAAYYLASSSPQKRFRAITDQGAKAGINLATVRDIPLAVPPTLTEQEAIAGALSDADAWIESLEQLIAKKRQIKQGAMQELLTGKHRLPGFSGEWRESFLKEIVECSPSGTYGLDRQSLGLVAIPVATTAQISNDDRWNGKPMNARYFTLEQAETYGVKQGDLIVVKSSGSAASIQSGKMVLVDSQLSGSFLFSNFLMRLRPRSVGSHFLYYYLTSSRIKKMLPSLCEASTYPNIRINEYLEIRVPLPSIAEQTAIASVLSDMDSEIGSLELKLAKAREVKQGMMQELLTGRIRLV